MNTEKPCDGQIVETKMMRKILKVVREKKRGGVLYAVYKHKNERQLLIRNTTSQKTSGMIFLNY